jgi:membrane protease YdiL (CAAX protease family)
MQNSNPIQVVSRVPGLWGSLLVLIGFVLIGMAVGNVLAVMVIALYLKVDTNSITTILNQLITNPAEVKNGWYALMMLQGTVHFLSYLLPSLLFWHYIERKSIGQFDFKETPAFRVWLIALLIVLVSIPINSKFIEWNSAMKLPDALSGMELWMREKEDQLSVMTAFMTNYTQFGQLLIALFVVVLLPAVGEEVLFRGIIQRKLVGLWGNYHVGIWVAAAIFSAIHFQFYGFLPRMMLGALFGYLYYWTGSLWVAILAHFVNNGFVLIMVYLNNIGVVKINIEETKTMPFMLIISSLLVTVFMLNSIRKAGMQNNHSW